MVHIPVLQKEAIELLNPKPNENFVDTTFGEGGHSRLILEKNAPNGKVLGIEADPELYQKKDLPERLILVNDSYLNLEKIVKERSFKPVNGILFDLGMSSWHLEESGRGFSLRKDEPLDMRYDPKNDLTAEKIVNQWNKKELQEILRIYGEERYAKSIVKKIIEERKKSPIKSTNQLKHIIKEAVPRNYQNQRLHFATRTFQALRIAVNNEIKNLGATLPKAINILEKKGRIVIISFHSGEDRIVKNFLKEESKKGRINLLTKKPIIPTKEETDINPRSRSAKLRAAVKM